MQINRDFFIHNCKVERATGTKDNSGQVIDTWATIYTVLPCYIKLNSGNESVVADKYADVATYRLYLAKGYTILNSDRIVSNSLTYEVIFVNNQIADHLEIDLIRIS
jgi:head-tail adaptor